MQKKYTLAIPLTFASFFLTLPTNADILVDGQVENFYTIEENSKETSLLISPWMEERKIHANTVALIDAIKDIENHGLNPDAYGINNLQKEIREYEEASKKVGSYLHANNEKQRKRLEAHLNKAFTSVVLDLGRGIINPNIQKGLHREAPKVSASQYKKELIEGKIKVSEVLTEITPSYYLYSNLSKYMRKLLDERDSYFERTKVEYDEAILFDSIDDRIGLLKKRLMETGDLPDESYVDNHFDDVLEEALISVQERHGLEETGELTQATVDALNATVDEDIEQAALNLERWRWMPRELGEQHVLVNVPAFKLSLMNGDQELADMRVVVGSKRHKTPIFSKEIKFIEVAPTWIVPASITNNELIPIERRKPGYLKSENLDFFRWSNGKLVPVPASQVTQADINTRPFPYVLQQRSGEDNALGLIKILMPNQFAVYMHDTQAKKLFSRAERAYSHGCIRLADPFRLGGLLLQLDGMSPDDTETLLAKRKTTRVSLSSHAMTHIAYYTAWVDNEGRFHKRKDVYGHDKKLNNALRASNTLLSTLSKRSKIVAASNEDL